MRIVILVDDLVPEGRVPVHGFSALVETDGTHLLFDTGPDGDLLMEALATEGVGVEDLDLVVVSHAHEDHVGGLSTLLYHRPRLPVSAPLRSAPSIAKMLHREAVVVGEKGPGRVAPHVWTTGDLPGEIPEQALVISTIGGNVILSGCGHSGLGVLLAAVDGNVVMVVGGLHGLSDEDISLTSLDGLVVCHCTPRKRLLVHTHDWIDLGSAGTVIEMEPPTD